jgi:hypothetical protein
VCAWTHANGVRGQITTTVGVLADAEGLRPIPPPCVAVLANFADRPPCRRKHRRPPSAEALAEADRIRVKDQALHGVWGPRPAFTTPERTLSAEGFSAVR